MVEVVDVLTDDVESCPVVIVEEAEALEDVL